MKPPQWLTTITSSIAGAALLIGASSLASRLLGLVRDRLFASTFGASATLDAYYAAFKIPDLLYNLIIVGALSAGFIPVFSRVRAAHGDTGTHTLFHRTLGAAAVLLIPTSLILLFLAPVITPLLTPGFSPEQQTLTTSFMRILAFSPLILGISAIAGGVLQSLKRFVAFSFAPVLYNLGIIMGITIFYPWIGLMGLPLGVILGALLHLALQALAVADAGFSWKIAYTFDTDIKHIGTLMIPRTLGLGVSQMNALILTALLSILGSGSLSAFQFATNIISVPLGLFAISYAVAAFPRFTSAVAEKKFDVFGLTLTATIRHIIFWMVPASVLFLTLRAQITRVLLGSGAFTWEDTYQTFELLGYLALGITAQGIVHVLTRAHYALENTRTPVMIAIFSELIIIISAYIAVYQLHAPLRMIGLIISVSAIVQVILLYLTIRRRIDLHDEKVLFNSLLTMMVAGTGMGIVAQYVKVPFADLVDMTHTLGILTQMSLTALASTSVYVIVAYALKLPEMNDLATAVRKKLVTRKNIASPIDDAHIH